MMELESGLLSASGIPEPVTATLAGPGSWNRCETCWNLQVTTTLTHGLVSEENYLGGCRFYFSFLLLVLFVGSRIHNQLFAPPTNKTVYLILVHCRTNSSNDKRGNYPLMISLFSPLIKYSCSGVMMHSEFFWPVLGSASITSVQTFMLTVPWGSVLGWRAQSITIRGPTNWAIKQIMFLGWRAKHLQETKRSSCLQQQLLGCEGAEASGCQSKLHLSKVFYVKKVKTLHI